MASPPGQRSRITTSSRVPLAEVAPDLVADLGEDGRELARRLVVPTRRLSATKVPLATLLEQERCFAMLVSRGLIIHRTSVGGRSATRVLGYGDIVTAGDSYLRTEHSDEYVVSDQSAYVALLGPEVLQATRQIPELLRALQLRMGAQHHRLVIQMAICQLPRVEDRVLAMLWLLAENWGKVSAEGTLLPIDLTHKALGELIGAKRPTVTLAVSELARRGAAERLSAGWLLHESPPEGVLDAGLRSGARVIRGDSPWSTPVTPTGEGDPEAISPEQLFAAIDGLRVDHEMNRANTIRRLSRARELRRDSERLRDTISRARASVR